MRIAINARSLSNRNMGGGYYTFHLLEPLVKRYPQHEFILLSDSPVDVTLASNASTRIAGKPVQSFFSLNRWLNRKVKTELKKLGADVFVSFDGAGCLLASMPQIIGFTDLNFLRSGSFFTRYLKERQLRKLICQSNVIVTVSQALKEKLISSYSVAEEKIHVIPKAPKEIFAPLEWKDKEAVKLAYADGKEYFLFTGGFEPANNLLNVLKAFSQFKKWQQSEMKLIILGNTSSDAEGMMQKIETFKFRSDVILPGKLSSADFHPVLASAYALIYPSSTERFGMPVLEAMRSGTPVITSRSIAAEVGGDAVIYVDAGDSTDIGNQMIRLYKDEDLRAKLVAAGLLHSAQFSWAHSAELLGQLIEKTVQQR